MSEVLVIQSQRRPLPFPWLEPCLESVAAWARGKGFDYRFIGDEFFHPVDPAILDKTRQQPVIASDLARLIWLQRGLDEGFATVVWCDADFLVFEAAGFELPAEDFALGREVWVQDTDAGRLRTYVKVHNAFLMFRRGNAFLDFYRTTAERLLHLNQGRMPPQFIGPKLLTALHNIARLPILESAAMLSPPVMRDLLAGGGEALDLFRRRSSVRPCGANLSSSLTRSSALSDGDMLRVIEMLSAGAI